MAATRSFFQLLAIVAVASCMASRTKAADADPILDFNIPGKNPQDAANTDFLFMGLRGAFTSNPMMGELQAAFANRNTFPALDMQGLSLAVLKLGPNGQNPTHEHPRATEVLFLIKGELEIGFVDTTGKVFRNTLYPGDITVFPRGLLHFQINKGKETALAVAALNSANPGALHDALPLRRLSSADALRRRRLRRQRPRTPTPSDDADALRRRPRPTPSDPDPSDPDPSDPSDPDPSDDADADADTLRRRTPARWRRRRPPPPPPLLRRQRPPPPA